MAPQQTGQEYWAARARETARLTDSALEQLRGQLTDETLGAVLQLESRVKCYVRDEDDRPWGEELPQAEFCAAALEILLWWMSRPAWAERVKQAEAEGRLTHALQTRVEEDLPAIEYEIVNPGGGGIESRLLFGIDPMTGPPL